MVGFIEALTVPSGEGAGGPFKLRPWQRRFIEDVYAPALPNGRRQVRRAVLSIARKNGKTALIAALALCHLCGPEAVANGEIYSAANEREQAAQVFKVAAQMVSAEPELAAILTVVESRKRIVCRANGSFYAALSREAGSKHGLNPSVVIYDELAQAKNRDLFDALDTAMGARAEPLFITISTQSNDAEHILSRLIDDGLSGADPTTVCHLYAADEDAELHDRGAWKAANPALGDFRSEEDVRVLASRAERIPAFEPVFRNLYLNQRVSPVSTLISRRDWMACQGAACIEPGEPVFLGLDLSARNDLTALVAVTVAKPHRVRAWFWKPRDTLEEHEKRDRAPYGEWAKAGWLDTPDGRSIPAEAVAVTVADAAREFEVVALAFDRWRMDVLLTEFDRIGLEAQKGAGSGLRLEEWGQGFRDMAPALDAFESAVVEGQLEQPGNPLLTWCVGNAMVSTDPAGNRKLDKSKTRMRIDGAVALAMALGIAARERAGEGAFDADSWIASYT